MSEQGDNPTPEATPAGGAGDVPIPGEGSVSPSAVTGNEPIAGEGSVSPGGGPGNEPIAGEGTTYSQKALDPIGGEYTQAVVAGGGIHGESTQVVREAEVPGERTVDVPLAENPDTD
jgi:hypothetical protein